MAKEEARQRGSAAPLALWNPSDEVHDLASDVELGLRHRKIVLAQRPTVVYSPCVFVFWAARRLDISEQRVTAA
jgi:hypothetical protein